MELQTLLLALAIEAACLPEKQISDESADLCQKYIIAEYKLKGLHWMKEKLERAEKLGLTNELDRTKEVEEFTDSYIQTLFDDYDLCERFSLSNKYCR